MAASHTVVFAGFSVVAPVAWKDVTNSLDVDDKPFTLSDPVYGFGAMQFSPAIYKAGVIANPSTSELRAMLDEFAISRRLGPVLESESAASEITLVGGTYHKDNNLVRVWYISDGMSVALLTYVCAWEHRLEEVTVCDDIVRSMKFRSA